MFRSRAKAAIGILTREHEFDGLVAWQSVRMAKQVQRGQAPIHAIQAQVLGQPVLKLVSPLQQMSTTRSQSHLRMTHSVQSLYVAHMLVDNEG